MLIYDVLSFRTGNVHDTITRSGSKSLASLGVLVTDVEIQSPPSEGVYSSVNMGNFKQFRGSNVGNTRIVAHGILSTTSKDFDYHKRQILQNFYFDTPHHVCVIDQPLDNLYRYENPTTSSVSYSLHGNALLNKQKEIINNIADLSTKPRLLAISTSPPEFTFRGINKGKDVYSVTLYFEGSTIPILYRPLASREMYRYTEGGTVKYKLVYKGTYPLRQTDYPYTYTITMEQDSYKPRLTQQHPDGSKSIWEYNGSVKRGDNIILSPLNTVINRNDVTSAVKMIGTFKHYSDDSILMMPFESNFSATIRLSNALEFYI